MSATGIRVTPEQLQQQELSRVLEKLSDEQR